MKTALFSRKTTAILIALSLVVTLGATAACGPAEEEGDNQQQNQQNQDDNQQNDDNQQDNDENDNDNQQNNDENDNDNQQNNNDQNGYEDPPADAELQHVIDGCDPDESICVMATGADEEPELSIEVLDGDGDPVENVLVEFDEQREVGDPGVELNPEEIATDADGQAHTELRSYGDLEQIGGSAVDVEASLADGPDIEPVVFDIGFVWMGGGNYLVEFSYYGDDPITHVVPRLYEADWSCEQLAAEYMDDGELPESAYSLPDVYVDGEEIEYAHFPDVEAGERYIPVGIGQQDDDIDTAFGCIDDTVEVDSGEVVRDSVELEQLSELEGD